jgi:hypothetical protein
MMKMTGRNGTDGDFATAAGFATAGGAGGGGALDG